MAHSAYSHSSILSLQGNPLLLDIHCHSSPLLRYQEVVQKLTGAGPYCAQL